MSSKRLLGPIAVVLALLGAGVACGDDAPKNKAVTDAGPVKLQLGTPDDDSEGPGGQAITEFVRLVRTASGGKLLVYPALAAAGENPVGWDQVVARRVESGELGMGMIP